MYLESKVELCGIRAASKDRLVPSLSETLTLIMQLDRLCERLVYVCPVALNCCFAPNVSLDVL